MAEVDIIRAELQQTDVTVEGEFMTVARMKELNFSETLGRK